MSQMAMTQVPSTGRPWHVGVRRRLVQVDDVADHERQNAEDEETRSTT